MNVKDPLERFERLAAMMRDTPPPVSVAPRVLGRIRAIRTAPDRTLAFLAAASCVAALLTVTLGVSWLSQSPDPLKAILEIVPQIGL